MLKSTVIKNKLRYPPSTDCAAIDKLFEGNDDQFKSYALLDKPATIASKGAGYYQCFCQTIKLTKITDSDHICKEFLRDKTWGIALGGLVAFVIAGTNFAI